VAKPVTRDQHETAEQLVQMIDDLRDQLTAATTPGVKLVLRRRMIKLIADRRRILGMDEETP
jgi:hypothetical protein